MTGDDLGRVLKRLVDGFHRNPLSDDDVDLWWDALEDIPFDRADRAARSVLVGEDFFPTLAKFREYLSKIGSEDRRSALVEARCVFCDGSGWQEGPKRTGRTFPSQSYETVHPCPGSNKVGYEQWESKWRHEGPRVEPEALYEANPVAGMAQARAALAAADQLTKNAKEL